MPKYVKFIKDLLINKAKFKETSKVTLNERCSAVLLNEIPLKERDPCSFTIPCAIGKFKIDKALADLGESISLKPYSMFISLETPAMPQPGYGLDDLESGFDRNPTLFAAKNMNFQLSSLRSCPNKKRSCFRCSYKAQDCPGMEVVQPQQRLNLKVKDMVKEEIVKLLDAGLIYAISDSPWISSIYVVPKKGGMTVITKEKNKLVPTRTVTRWRMCIDYRKLNDATRKDHFPLPFIDQMLEPCL
ncbi:hypothetical protein Tco_1341790, partial [Tanacetum coccineum]